MVNPAIARAGAEDVLVPREGADPLRVCLSVRTYTGEVQGVVDFEFAGECPNGQGRALFRVQLPLWSIYVEHVPFAPMKQN